MAGLDDARKPEGDVVYAAGALRPALVDNGSAASPSSQIWILPQPIEIQVPATPFLPCHRPKNMRSDGEEPKFHGGVILMTIWIP